MASKVEICNMALQRIGADRITALTDNTESANAVSTIYDMVADEVMAAGAWTTCLVRTVLAQSTTTPSFDYDYQYQLPTDPKCLRVVKVNADYPSEIEYRIEGDKLLTDETTVSILYVARLANTSSYGPNLTKAIVSRLAAELSYKFSATAKFVDRMEAKAEKDLMDALSADGVQGSVLSYINDDINRTRD